MASIPSIVFSTGLSFSSGTDVPPCYYIGSADLLPVLSWVYNYIPAFSRDPRAQRSDLLYVLIDRKC
jgi:hypothetical protein